MKLKFTFLKITLMLIGCSNLAIAQWSQTNFNSGAVYCLTPVGTDLFAGTPYNGIKKLSNGGASSADASTGLPSNASIQAIHVANNVMYAGTSAGVYKSTDNGANWALSGLSTFTITSLTSSSTAVFAGTSQSTGGVYRSTDNGANWTAVNTGLTTTYGMSRLAYNGTTLVAATGLGAYASTDNGDNWTSISALSSFSLTALETDGTKFYAGSSAGRVYTSTDNGATFPETNPFFGGAVDAFTFTGTNAFVGGYGPGVGLSASGAAWTSQNTGLNYNNVNALAIIGGVIYSGADGGGVWKRALSEMGISAGVKNVSANNNLNIFPNPTTGKLNFAVPTKSQMANIEIYNIVGEKVMQQKNTNEVDLGASPKGIYLVKVYDGESNYIQKIVVE